MSDNYVIFNPEGGLGKIIASTAVLKYIEKKYPDHKIIVLTPWAEVFVNNPRVYRFYKSGNHPYFYNDFLKGRKSVVLRGEPYFQTDHLYSNQHLIKSWCELFNLPYDSDCTPELYFTNAELENYNNNIASDKPILLFQTNGGPWDLDKTYSWTRDFPHKQSQILVDELSKMYNILHICRDKGPQLNNVTRIGDTPNKRIFLSLLLKTEKRVLIDSCLQHAAAALNLPSTVCWVGTNPKVFGYEIHKNILPSEPKKDLQSEGVDSLFFDHDFNGPEHEFPFNTSDIFNLQNIFDSVTK